MKKALVAAVCSGLVIPGLGQIMNGELKKGVLLLGSVFVLLLCGFVRLFFMVRLAIQGVPADQTSTGEFSRRFLEQDFSLLGIIAGLFVVIWAYAVIDAFLTGNRLEKTPGKL